MMAKRGEGRIFGSSSKAPISRDFGIAADRLEWIVITYTLTLVALTLVALTLVALTLVALTSVSGRISDMLGRIRIFTLGFVGFIISSLPCSLAAGNMSTFLTPYVIQERLGFVTVTVRFP